MVVMAAVALLLLAIFVGVGLHRALNRPPFTRERPPIVPLHLPHRSPRAAPNNSYLFDTVPDTSSSSNSVTLKGFTMRQEDVVDIKVLDGEDVPDGQVGVVTVSTVHMSSHSLTQNPLQRSVSQLIDRKAGQEEEEWEHFRAQHSNMFDEEFVDSIKGFSTVRKEHTMFTDTNL